MDQKRHAEAFPSAGDTVADLRGRQSVRATFKLTNICIEAISIVAGQLGIKQKSLFDHLFQDTQTLSAIARGFSRSRLHGGQRVQKTYVMSRQALISLEDIARNFNAPRDMLIEQAVARLMPIIASERHRHEKRKQMVEKVRIHLESGHRLLNEAMTELGQEDPIAERLSAAIGFYESAARQMAGFIEKTKDIEAFEPLAFELSTLSEENGTG